MVEAALIDAAARVFLEKLGQTDKLGQTTGGNSPEANPPPPPSAEVVDQAAIDACVRAFRGLDDGKPPALMRDLDDERVWVLLDIARHGTGWSRQRATSELRDSLRALSEQPRGKGKLLGSLLRQLRSAVSAGFPVVFRALLLETEVGLRRLRDPKAPRVTQ